MGHNDFDWLASVVAATIGYFGFGVLLSCTVALLEPPPVGAPSWDFYQLGVIVVQGMGVSIFGLIFVVGWPFYVLSVLVARIIVGIYRCMNINHWALFCIGGAVAGVLLGCLFAQFMMYQLKLYDAPVVAGAVDGMGVGLLLFLMDRHYRKRVLVEPGVDTSSR